MISKLDIRTLIVEDDPTTRRVLEHMLRQRGHHVETFGAAEPALAAHAENPFNLMLLDWQLPGMDGVEMCRKVRSHARGQDVLIVVVTGRDTSEDLAEVLEAGASDYLAKPIGAPLLRTRLAIAEHRMLEAKRHREAEAALIASEARYQRMAANVPGMVFQYQRDANGNQSLNYVSEGCREIFGVAPSELRRKPGLFLQLVHPDDRSDMITALEMSQRTLEPWHFEGRTRRPNGSVRWFQIGSRPIRGSDNVVLWDGLLVDITARKETEEALRESEQSLATILNSIQDAVVATDEQNRVVRLNRVAEMLIGTKEADAQGRNLGELVSLQTPDSGRSESHGSSGSRLVLQTKSGDLPVAVRISSIKEGSRTTGNVLVLRDVSEEIKAQETLRRTQRDFNQIIENSPDGMLIARDGRLIYGNSRVFSMLRSEARHHVIGKTLMQLIHPADRQALNPTGRLPKVPREVRFICRDGGELTLEVAPPQHIQFEGQPAHLWLLRDITERKRMQARLLLADRMVSVGTLAAGVAHEMNNPLAYVIANLHYLSEELPLLAEELPNGRMEEPLEVLDVTCKGIERVRRIIKDLRTFSRADDGDVGPVNIQEALDQSINLAMNEIRHRATLITDYNPIPAVLGNEGRLNQVFLNLLVNAAQSLPEGSVDENEVQVRTYTNEKSEAVIEIGDTGCGISKEHLSRIFDPFFTTKQVGVGTGLGLSICHGIITQHNGEIMVESHKGEGTLFRMIFPPYRVGSKMGNIKNTDSWLLLEGANLT